MVEESGGLALPRRRPRLQIRHRIHGQRDELDGAIAIDRMQQALDIEVRRVEHSWAGLRTFTPDRSLAFGWAGDAPGFFWVVGQGGYGIQAFPARRSPTLAR